MRMKKAIVALLFLTCFMASNGFCEDFVYLKNGKAVSGEIVQETPYSVKIRKSNGSVEGFYADEIERVVRGNDSSAQLTGAPDEKAVFPELSAIPDRKKELILRFLKVSGVYESVSESLDSVVKNLSEDKRAEIRKILSVDDLIMQVVPIYAAYYNEEEISVLIDYYGNPVIQKNMKLTPQILQSVLNEVMKHLSQKLQTLTP